MNSTLMGDFDVLVVGLVALTLACFLVAHTYAARVWPLERAVIHLMSRPARLTARDRALVARLARQSGQPLAQQMGVAAPPTRPMRPQARDGRQGRRTPRLRERVQ